MASYNPPNRRSSAMSDGTVESFVVDSVGGEYTLDYLFCPEPPAAERKDEYVNRPVHVPEFGKVGYPSRGAGGAPFLLEDPPRGTTPWHPRDATPWQEDVPENATMGIDSELLLPPQFGSPSFASPDVQGNGHVKTVTPDQLPLSEEPAAFDLGLLLQSPVPAGHIASVIQPRPSRVHFDAQSPQAGIDPGTAHLGCSPRESYLAMLPQTTEASYLHVGWETEGLKSPIWGSPHSAHPMQSPGGYGYSGAFQCAYQDVGDQDVGRHPPSPKPFAPSYYASGFPSFGSYALASDRATRLDNDPTLDLKPAACEGNDGEIGQDAQGVNVMKEPVADEETTPPFASSASMEATTAAAAVVDDDPRARPKDEGPVEADTQHLPVVRFGRGKTTYDRPDNVLYRDMVKAMADEYNSQLPRDERRNEIVGEITGHFDFEKQVTKGKDLWVGVSRTSDLVKKKVQDDLRHSARSSSKKSKLPH